MKKIFLLLALFCGLIMAAQTNNDWEDWQKTSCYSKISFRLKYVEQRGEQHVWKVQFKNDYQQLISFSYHVTDKLQEYNTTTHRKIVNGKQVSDEVEVFTSLQDMYIIVDKVSLSAQPRDYIDCETQEE